MDTVEEQIETITSIIKENNFDKLEKYIKENDVVLKDLNSPSFDVLILAIENNVSLNMLKYIIEQSKYDTLNYVINEHSVQKVPLISAIMNNNFRYADMLIENKANINQFDVIYYLFKINKMNNKNLRYILVNGFNIKNITPYLINELIETKNNHILKVIFNYFIFNNSFILKLLHMYKKKEPISNLNLQDMLINEKSKIHINEKMYEKAIDKNNYEAVKILFEHDGSDSDMLYYKANKYDILEKAVKTNDYNFVKNILSYEDFNFKNINSKKIFMEANKNNNLDIMKLLIKVSLDSTTRSVPSSPEHDGYMYESSNSSIPYLNYIINMAIKINNFDMVKYLIEGDDFKFYLKINEGDINGECPIITAFYEDNYEMFRYLLDHGANCNVKSNGNSLLSLAIDEYDNTKYLKCLLQQKIDINEKDINDNYPFIKAIKKNNINVIIMLVKYSIRHNIDLNIMDNDGNTPLILSYRLNYFEIFRFLVKYLDINRKDSNGNTLLYYAILKEDIDTIEYLIDIGADINCIYNSGGKSALDLAISKGFKFINILLSNKNNILLNIPNMQGETPLITIIKSEDYTIEDKRRIITKMIKKGSNVNFIDKDGNTPLVYAIQMKSLPIIKMLIENGAYINYTIKNSILMKAIGLGELDVVKYLVECNANINYKNEFGNTPLAYAISVKNENIVKYLIDCGADIYNKNNQGQTLYSVNRSYNFNSNNNSFTEIGKRINKLLGFQ